MLLTPYLYVVTCKVKVRSRSKVKAPGSQRKKQRRSHSSMLLGHSVERREIRTQEAEKLKKGTVSLHTPRRGGSQVPESLARSGGF
jgi:hypothetical protein